MSRRPLSELAPEHVRRFEAYAPSPPDHVFLARHGLPHLLRLHNNENHLGPPPAAARVIAEYESGRGALYPSGDCYDLRQALGKRFAKDPGRFLVGNGSCEVIASVIKAFCGPGDNIVTADKTFAVYEWVAEFSGFEARLTPLRNGAYDPEALLEAMDERTKIVFVCNPNNPTGGRWNLDTTEDFLARVDGRAIVVMDEAYFEYVDKPDHPDGMELMERHPNVVVFRTFSKMYALAGLRIGWLCGTEEVVEMIRRTHIVYSVNGLGQAAALAALSDDAGHIAATRAMVAEARAYVHALAGELGLAVQDGEGNFAMLKVPVSDTLLARKLLLQGVMVRTMTGFRFPGWIRVSLAPMPMMQAFGDALRKALGKA